MSHASETAGDALEGQEYTFMYGDQAIALNLSDYTPELLSEFIGLTPEEQASFLKKRFMILDKTANKALNKIRWKRTGLFVSGKKVATWNLQEAPPEEFHEQIVRSGIERVLRDVDIQTLKSARVLVRKSQVGFIIGGAFGAMFGLPQVWFKGGSVGTALILTFDFKAVKFSANWVFDKETMHKLYASTGGEISLSAFIGFLVGNNYLYQAEPHRLSRDVALVGIREISHNHRGVYLLSSLTFPPFPLSMLTAYTYETTRTRITSFDVDLKDVRMKFEMPFIPQLIKRLFTRTPSHSLSLRAEAATAQDANACQLIFDDIQ